MSLDREALRAAKDLLPRQAVPVAELGGEVLLRGMSAKELLSFQQSIQRKDRKGGIAVDEETFAAKLLVRSIVNDRGERMFGDDEWQELEQWPAAVFQRLAEAALKLNGYGSAEGNLPTTRGGASSSG
jgi:hypothetical protein